MGDLTPVTARELSNPYAPGMGTPPPYLAGRDQDLRLIEVMLARLTAGQPVKHRVFSGLRGVGKTVLLGKARERAVALHWVVAKVEGDADASVMQSLRVQLEECMADLQPSASLGNRLTSALQGFQISLGPLQAGVQFRDPDRQAIMAPELSRLVVLLGQAARARRVGLLLALDEMHLIHSGELKAILAAVHETNQLQLPVGLLGAGLPQLPVMLQAAKTYAERISVVGIGRLDAEAARASIVLPAERLGVAYAEDALALIAQHTGGYPFFLQSLGELAFGSTEASTVHGADVLRVLPDYHADLDRGFFGPRMVRARPASKRYLAAMATLIAQRNTEMVGSQAVAELLGQRITSLSPQRDDLISKGLIFAGERGRVGFTVPLFEDYLRRAHPELLREVAQPRTLR